MLAMSGERRTERGPARTCVGCGQAAPQADVRRADARAASAPADAAGGAVLVRLILGPGGAIAVDTGDGTFGRGAYVHATPACVARAVRGLPRAARSSVSLDGAAVTERTLREAISTAYDRRIASLLATARRAKKVECGSDAVTAACRANRASLVVVATDAAQAADLTEVRRARQEGRVIPWGTKLSLASSISGQTDASGDVQLPSVDAARRLGVVAVTDTRIAHAVKEAWLVAASLAHAPHVAASPKRDATSIPAAGPATLSAPDSEQSSRSQSRDPGGSSGAVE